MNKRLHDIMIDATSTSEFIAGNYYWPPEYVEKFTELIIKECASLCEDLSFQYERYRMEETDFGMKNIYAEGQAACDVIQHKMKKHFGIEQ